MRERVEYIWQNNSQSSSHPPPLLPTYWVVTSVVLYIYDGLCVIQQRNTNGTPTVSYTRGPDLSGSLEGAGGIGGLLARSDGYSGGHFTSHNYYHADGDGNITYLETSSQTLAASYRYDPFGNTISSGGTYAAANVYRFSSKEIHANSGMYYFLARFYNPSLQRWLNRDPIGEAGGINLYGFVGNAPSDLVDPYGFEAGYTYEGGRMYSGVDPQNLRQNLPIVAGVAATAAIAALAPEALPAWGSYLWAAGAGAAGGYVGNGVQNKLNGQPFNQNAGRSAAVGAALGVAGRGLVGLAKGLRVCQPPKLAPLTKPERLKMVFDRLTAAPHAKTAQEAMQQMKSTLDAVEDAYSGIPKNPNPGLTPDGRMYPVQPDRMATAADGTITATSRGHITTYGSDGSITVTERTTGAVVYHKP